MEAEQVINGSYTSKSQVHQEARQEEKTLWEKQRATDNELPSQVAAQ